MARVKRGTTKLKHRKNVLSRTKGFRFNLSTKERAAHTALAHAGNHAFGHRRDKKGDFRRLYTVRLNAAVREFGMSYSVFINKLKAKDLNMSRKVLATLATDHKEAFERLIKHIS